MNLNIAKCQPKMDHNSQLVSYRQEVKRARKLILVATYKIKIHPELL